MEGEYMKGNTQDLTKGSIVKAIILFNRKILNFNLPRAVAQKRNRPWLFYYPKSPFSKNNSNLNSGLKPLKKQKKGFSFFD